MTHLWIHPSHRAREGIGRVRHGERTRESRSDASLRAIRRHGAAITRQTLQGTRTERALAHGALDARDATRATARARRERDECDAWMFKRTAHRQRDFAHTTDDDDDARARVRGAQASNPKRRLSGADQLPHGGTRERESDGRERCLGARARLNFAFESRDG